MGGPSLDKSYVWVPSIWSVLPVLHNWHPQFERLEVWCAMGVEPKIGVVLPPKSIHLFIGLEPLIIFKPSILGVWDTPIFWFNTHISPTNRQSWCKGTLLLSTFWVTRFVTIIIHPVWVMIRSPVPLDTENVGKKDLEKVQVIYKLKHLFLKNPFEWYCWWKKSYTSWWVGYPIIHRVLCIHPRWLFGISSINRILFDNYRKWWFFLTHPKNIRQIKVT